MWRCQVAEKMHATDHVKFFVNWNNSTEIQYLVLFIGLGREKFKPHLRHLAGWLKTPLFSFLSVVFNVTLKMCDILMG